MPSLIGHTLVGVASASLGRKVLKNISIRKLIFLSFIAANAPDFDVLFHHLGLDHLEFFAHRNGFFHSVFFCLLFGFITAYVFFRNLLFKMSLYFFLVSFSHLLFDSMTKDIGVSFLYPFMKEEFIFPIAPLLPSGFSLDEFQAGGVIFREAMIIWLPCISILLLTFFVKKKNVS